MVSTPSLVRPRKAFTVSTLPTDVTDLDTIAQALRSSGAAEPDAVLAGAEFLAIGEGAMADTFKVHMTWVTDGTGPSSLVMKRPSTDVKAAATAASLGAYEREARFYTELAPRSAVRAPGLLGVMTNADSPVPDTVLLEDLTDGYRPGEQLSETPLIDVRRARHQLALLQAPFWDDPKTAALPWLHRRIGVPIPGILERMDRSWSDAREIRESLDPPERECIDRFVAGAGKWAQSASGPCSLVHHDYRVDNMLFSDSEVVAIDWQTIGWGPVLFDFAYLLGTSLETETRRSVERDELVRYLADLEDLGVDWSLDRAWEAYRWSAFAVLLMLVPPISSVKSTPRSDAMFRRLLALGARFALDLDSLELLSA